MINLNTGLDIKVGGDSAPVNVKYDIIPEDKYTVELVRVYKPRKITKDTFIAVRDENGKVTKDSAGNTIKTKIENLEWYNIDLLFKVVGGEYDGTAVKGSLSTHPDMQRGVKQFLYCSSLFGVELSELDKHLGAVVTVKTQNKTRTFPDKDTGLDKTVTDVVVHWYIDPKDDIENLGI